jgi:pimeloyl-ACP methyl ester carboxylesterase/DNA-binding winged helix-turn-helix (wHTH) protein
MIYRFAGYELDTGLFELREAGAPRRLEPQVFDVLTYLVEHRDRLVTKDELLEKVWGDKYISEAALNSRLMAARKAIGDSGSEQRFIRTQHGRGFRFIGEVEIGSANAGSREMAGQRAAGQTIDRATRLHQEVRFCTAPDGVRIAYATVGSGFPLLKAPNWLTHLEYEWQSPIWRHWWEALAQDFELIRFDQRGSGLSDWDVGEMSLESWVLDLETVADAVGLERFHLLGVSQGGAVAVEYAIRHPERVARLVLYGAFTRGRVARGESPEVLEAVQTLMRDGWGRDNPAYRQMFTSQFMPGATREQMNWFNELQRVSTSGENAARIQEVGSHIEILDRLALVSVPTLVLHATGDERVPFDQGRLLASSIPNARLVALDSRNHLTLEDEPAWPKLIGEVKSFLRRGSLQADSP